MTIRTFLWASYRGDREIFFFVSWEAQLENGERQPFRREGLEQKKKKNKKGRREKGEKAFLWASYRGDREIFLWASCAS